MKKIYLTLVAIFAVIQVSYAQWNVSGTNIFNNNTGYVGIGTSTPGSALQVNGGAAIGYSASTAAPTNGLIVSGNSTFGGVATFNNQLIAQTGTTGLLIGGSAGLGFGGIWSNGVTQSITNYSFLTNSVATILHGTANVYLSVNNNAIVTLSSSGAAITGNLAVNTLGVTSAAGNGYINLHRTGNTLGYGLIYDTNGTNDWILGNNALSNSDFSLYNYGTATNVLTVLRASGNVGIGTTIPMQALEVAGNIAIGRTDSGLPNTHYVGSYSSLFGGIFQAGLALTDDSSSNSQVDLWTTQAGVATASRMTILPNGKVGIGTTSPTTGKLVVNNVGGTVPALTIDANDQAPARLKIINSGGSTFSLVSGTVGASNSGFAIYDDSNSATRMQIDGTNGYVGIGTTTPHEALSVNGNIRSKQVKVETANWPDYVFKPTYNLPSLKDVKKYIDQNQHLPELPSEKDIAKNGLDLGEMNKLLAKKVEELTLYMIEKDKQVNNLQSELNELKQQVAAIIKALSK